MFRTPISYAWELVICTHTSREPSLYTLSTDLMLKQYKYYRERMGNLVKLPLWEQWL